MKAAFRYSFLTKSAKLKQRLVYSDVFPGYSFLTKSAKLKLLLGWLG